MDAPDEMTGPVNLSNPTEFTILELAEMVIAMTGSKSKIEFKLLPEDDPRQRQPDISLAKEKLGWQPQTPLEEGLERTIAYFKPVSGNQRHVKYAKPLFRRLPPVGTQARWASNQRRSSREECNRSHIPNPFGQARASGAGTVRRAGQLA